MYACVSSFLNLPPISYPIPLLSIVTEHWVELPVSQSKFPLAILFYTWQCIYFHASLFSHLILSFPYCVHKSLLCVCLFITALQIGLLVPSF